MPAHADGDLTPQIHCDDEILRANARAWRQHGGRPVRAVIKSDGYGWGLARLARVLDQDVDGFCVADVHEFRILRALTDREIVLFASTLQDDIAEVMRTGGIPNITSLTALDTALASARSGARRLRIRIGLAPVLGWSGIALAEAEIYAQRLSKADLEVELWTHLTAPEAQAHELAAFAQLEAIFAAAAVRVVGSDIQSSRPLAAGAPRGTHVRIGIGLFGAYRTQVPALRSALRIDAKVVARESARDGLAAGYARRAAPSTGMIETLRIGYGDGFPPDYAGEQILVDGEPAVLLSVGMQYTVIAHALVPAPIRNLFHAETNLVAFAEAARISPHRFVVGCGLAQGSRPD